MERIGTPPDENELRTLCWKTFSAYERVLGDIPSLIGMHASNASLITGRHPVSGRLDAIGFQFLVEEENMHAARAAAEKVADGYGNLVFYTYPGKYSGRKVCTFYPCIVTAHQKLAHMAQKENN